MRAISLGIAAIISITAATGAEPPADPAARLEATRAEIAQTRTNIVLTLEELDQVRRVEDPHAQFQKFVEQLDLMKERARLTQERARVMREKSDTYFADWQTRNAAATEGDARQQSEEALAKSKAAYDRIVQQMQLARTNFTPLLSELEQIKTLLEGQRSKEQVAEAKDLFMQANWHCVSVQRALINAEQGLGSLAEGLPRTQPVTPADKPKP